MAKFSRSTVVEISPSKDSEDVLKVIPQKLSLEYPRRAFYEIKHNTLEKLAKRQGIQVELSPSYFQWSNGQLEKAQSY